MTVKEANEYYKQNAKCVKEIFSGLRRRTECFSHPCKDCLWDLTKEREAKDMAIRSLEAWEKVLERLTEMANDKWNEQVGSSKGLNDAIEVIEDILSEVER